MTLNEMRRLGIEAKLIRNMKTRLADRLARRDMSLIERLVAGGVTHVILERQDDPDVDNGDATKH